MSNLTPLRKVQLQKQGKNVLLSAGSYQTSLSESEFRELYGIVTNVLGQFVREGAGSAVSQQQR